MNCVIVDDEPMAQGILEDYIKKVPYLTLVKKCSSAVEASDVLLNNKVDLIFLDIMMPMISGTDFLKGLSNKPLVVFTTAHSDFAIEAFQLNAIDYLLKPFSFERFFGAVSKAGELFSLRNQKKYGQDKQLPMGEAGQTKKFILVKSDYKTIKVVFEDILYIEGLKDYVKIYLASRAKPVITHKTLKKMTELLPETDFMRVHKSFIVSITNIESVTKNQVVFGDKTIPLGQSYKEVFFEHLGIDSLA